MYYLLSNGKMLANDDLQRTLKQEIEPCFMVKYKHLPVRHYFYSLLRYVSYLYETSLY
jgi:hypothetical protein